MSERSDWEKHKNYPPSWSWATWSERAGMVAVWIVASAVGLAMAIGVLFVIESSIDGITQHIIEHDRCLKQATNGYEIKRCN
jgi:phosphate/sulfate permease